MIKKINKFVNLSIIASIIFTIIGLCLIIFPDVSLNIISYIIGGLFLILGIYLFTINYNSLILTDMIFFGVMMVLLGIILIVYPKIIAQLIPIVLGIWFITDSIIKIRISLSLKEYSDSPWILTLILAIISMLCGIIFILHPLASSEVITSFIGILIMVYALSDIIDMFMFKKHINNVANSFKKNIKVIDME